MPKKVKKPLKNTKPKQKQVNLPQVAKTKTRQQKFTTGYYHCLANNWGSGKITDCCAKCKKDAKELTLHRNQELKKLGQAYRQIGDSLFRLFKPLNSRKH